MADRPYKILLVEPDPELVELFVSSLSTRFGAHITCVVDAKTCLDVEMLEPHDLVITEWDLEGQNGLDLAKQLTSLSQRPVILMAERLKSAQVVEVLRAGVRDVFLKPFAIDELLDSSQRVLYGHDVRRKHAVRHHKLRKLVRQVIGERRDLNKRIELVCRDLVDAHRRLVHRVVNIHGARSN